MTAKILIERNGPITTITLNRPDVRNAIDAEMHHDLQIAFDDFSNDPTQQIAVITGAGELAFSAGSDLKAKASSGGSAGYPKSGYAGLIERYDLAKPVIAAVNGFALGGGFEIVLACDLVIATESASFGLPEPRVGAVALGGGIHRLVRQIGMKPAMGMLLACERIDAKRAFTLGLVNEVAPDGHLHEAVARWCGEILKGAPSAVQATKEAAHRGLTEPSLAAAIKAQSGYPAWAAHMTGPNPLEGARAFAEKRSPRWSE